MATDKLVDFDHVTDYISRQAAINIVCHDDCEDCPHNFQRERSDIASYMHWITSVMKEAKAWWKKLLKARENAEKALEGMKNDK